MIRILVFASEASWREGNHCFERLVSWDKSIRFPVEESVSTFKALWGENAVVQVNFL